MARADSGKVCVVCGESCENRPRVKDPKGRYFCRACYEKAIEQKRHAQKKGGKQSKPKDDHSSRRDRADEGSSSSSSTPPRAASTLGAEDWGSSLADDLDDDSGEFAPPASPSAPSTPEAVSLEGKDVEDAGAATAAGACPNCGADFPLAAIICVNCGYNTTTGHTVEANVGGTVVAKEDVPTDTIWPSVIGILAVVVGIGYTGLSVWGLVDLLLGGGEVAEIDGVDFTLDPTWNIILASLLSLPLIAVMLWHSFAGIGLIQRREWGHRHMTLWAKSIITIVLTLFLLIGGGLIVLALIAGAIAAAIFIVFILAVAAGILLIWPIALLLWLRRDGIEAEVESWE